MPAERHAHDLQIIHRNVLGFRSKRNDGQTNDVEWYAGDVKRCARCARMFFVPHGANLSTVECELAGAAELEKVWPPRSARAA